MNVEKSLEESAEKRDGRVVLGAVFCATMVGFIIKPQVLSLLPLPTPLGLIMTAMWRAVMLGIVYAGCTFREEAETGFVFAQSQGQIEAETQAFSLPLACPELAGNATCCTEYQNRHMRTYFYAIDLAFSRISGGCDMCAAGLKHMWCHLACSPHQEEYVSWSNSSAGVIELEFAVSPRTASAVYEACKWSAMVSRVPAMQSPLGFLQYQAEMSSHSIPLTLSFVQKLEFALDLSFAPCDFPSGEVYGYPVTGCTCATCDALCSAEVHRPLALALTIADWLGVGLGYICLSVFLAAVAVVVYIKQR